MADYSGSVSLLGILLALCSVGAWSFIIIYYEHSGLSEIDGEAVVFYNCCCQLLLGVSTSIISGGYADVTGSMLVHIFLSFVGIGLGIAAQVMLQTAIVNIGSGLSGIMGVLEPVSSLLLGGLLLKDVLTPRQMIAAVVTLAGITLVLISENTKEPAVKGNS